MEERCLLRILCRRIQNVTIKNTNMHSVENDSIKLSLDTARTLAVYKQGLSERPVFVDKKTLLNTIRQIGLLQLDTINVVARNHYLVMLSRVGLYNSTDLDALLYPDRCLFEHRAHAACLIPTEDYEYFAPVILASRQQPHRKIDRLGTSAQDTLETVLTEVTKRGPLASKDFDDPRSERGGWWDWKPAKLALEILFEQGYLMIDHRVNFQRYYDLAEHVLPNDPNIQTKTIEDWKCWTTLCSLLYLGVATIEQISDYYRQQKADVHSTIKELLTEGTVIPTKVEGWKEQAYLNSADRIIVEAIEAGLYRSKLTVFLPPFDNLIWDRRRVHDLFGFDYHVELYTPLAKKERQYGYYVLPILHHGRLVGRLDPKVDRQSKTLIIHSILIENNQPLTECLLVGISGALREFMAFHDTHSLVIERTSPEKLKTELLSLM